MLLLSPGVLHAQEHKKALPPLHHIVKVKPAKGMRIPKNFPLNEQGQIDCQTCHGIKNIEGLPFNEVDKTVDNFHRGGPYRQLTEFCYNCHQEKDYQRNNIHKLLNEKGEYDTKACEYCHKKAPDPKQKLDRQRLEFRLPPQSLCIGCHLKTPHLNALTHQSKPDEAMLKRIRQSEQQQGVILPLDGDGRIMCATCHAPHEPGVIDETRPAGRQVADVGLDKGVSYVEHPWDTIYKADKKSRLEQLARQSGKLHSLSYQRLRHEVLLRLPAKDGALCQACHEFDR